MNANTSWMNSTVSFDPSKASPNTGINGGATPPSAVQNNQPSPPSQVSNGTMLGSIAAGNYPSQAPLGFDQAKWNDPNAGNSLKYQVGRMAAAGVPIEQIAQNVGAKVIAPDKIQYPDGFVADIYYDYGGPNQRVQYTDVTPQGQYNPAPNQSGSLINPQMSQNNMMNQIYQAMLARRQQIARQGYNPSGGDIAPPVVAYQPNTGYQPISYGSMIGSGNMYYPGGGVYDPITGTTRAPRPGEPQ